MHQGILLWVIVYLVLFTATSCDKLVGKKDPTIISPNSTEIQSTRPIPSATIRTQESEVSTILNVGYAVAERRTVYTHREIAGVVRALREVEVRPKVSGQLVEQLYTEGRLINQGDPLFQIDRTTYDLNYQKRQLQLQKAQAALSGIQAMIQSNSSITPITTEIRNQLNVLAARSDQAEANVRIAELQLQAARNELNATRVVAPISGFVGRPLVSVGSFVQPGQSPLAVVQELNPAIVEFTHSGPEIQKLAAQVFKAINVDDVQRPVVKIKLPDQSQFYPHNGNLDLTALREQNSREAVTLKAVVPNPNYELLPGTNVTVLYQDAVTQEQIIIPHIALRQAQNNRGQVWIINNSNVVNSRTITLGQRMEDQWSVQQGILEGEKVAVEYLDQLQNGMQVNPILAIPIQRTEILSE